jgi:hypothetical protein
MALRHGRTRYTRGCRCNVCKAAERDYQRNRYRHRRGLPVDPPEHPPLSVVSAEGHVMLARSNPRWQPNWPLYALPPTGRALAQAALALARILDNPRAVSSQASSSAGARHAAGRAQRRRVDTGAAGGSAGDEGRRPMTTHRTQRRWSVGVIIRWRVLRRLHRRAADWSVAMGRKSSPRR